MAAVYTAYLFAQAKARDLWQSPLLPPHLAVQAVLAGAAALLLVDAVARRRRPATTRLGPGRRAPLAHLLMVAGEVTLGPSHRPRPPGRPGDDQGPLRPVLPGRRGAGVRRGSRRPVPRAPGRPCPLALVGLLAHEHAYVQAGQAVPLA